MVHCCCYFTRFYGQIGCDIPGITADVVSEAFSSLAAQSKLSSAGEVQRGAFTLGPAVDGGYYLVACHCSIAHKLGKNLR